ncbi:MAG: sialidase family protein [Pyrinomonadaceae bacterium]
MNFQAKINKLKASAAILTMLFFAGCQPKQEVKENLPAKPKAEMRISASDADAAEPAIAADSDGNVYVVYVEHNTDKSADVYLQKFDADGKSNGEKTRINPEKGQAKAWFGDAPTIKISQDRRVFVGWTAKVESLKQKSASVLNLSVSGDGGKTFDAPVKVNDDTAPASHGMHSLAIGKDGRVFMAWLDERNVKSEKLAFNEENALPEGFEIVKAHHNSNQATKKDEKSEMKHEESEPNSEIFFAVSSDGGKTFSANKKLSSEVCPCCKTSIVVAPDGKAYVSWRQVLTGDFRHIAVASSADGGESFSAPAIASDDKWQINACPVSGSAMTVDSAGALKVVWYTAGEAGKPGLYYAESKDGGKTFSPRALISNETVVGTSTVLSENGEKSRIVFSEATNQVAIGEAENSANNFSIKETIKDAELANAAFAGEKLFVAFVRKEGEKQSVWLYAQN